MKKIISLFILVFLTVLPYGECLSRAFGENIEGAQKGILPNGLTYVVENIPKDSRIVSIEALVKTGSSSEYEYSGSGISHFVEHMLFKGTKKFAVGEIEKKIKSMGGYMNGATSLDATTYVITAPSEYVSDILMLLCDMLFNASFKEEEFNKEKNVILKEIRLREDEPSQYINELLYENAYLNHPYKYPVIGYEPIFKNLKRQDLINYYNRNYVAPNIIVSIAGNIDIKKTGLDVEKVFGGIQRKSPQSIVLYEEPPINGCREMVKFYPTPLAYIMLGFEGTDINSNDLYSLDALAIILGQGESSRLQKALIKEKRIAYDISSWNYTPRDRGLFEIFAAMEPEKYQEVIDDIFKEIEKIKSGGVSESELLKAKKEILSSYIFSRENSSAQAHDLSSNEAYTGDINFSKLYVQRINSLKISDIKIAANKYLLPENFVKIILLPKNFELKEASKNPDVLKKEIKKIILPNGITLILKEDKAFPIIALSAIFKGGVRFEEPSKNGVSELMSKLLLKGTKTKSEKEISELIENNGISIDSFSGNNTFGIKMKFLSENEDIALGIFSDLIKNSVFSESEFKRELDLSLADLRVEESDVFGLGIRKFRKSIFKKHPYGNSPTGNQDSLKNLKDADCIKFYNDFCRPDNMVVAISGDIDEKKITAKLEGLFSDFKRAPIPEINIASEPAQDALRKSEVILDKKEALVVIGAKTTTLKDPDKFPLEVISSVMSGQDGRLFKKIRSSAGIAYSLGDQSIIGIDPGYFIFYAATTKEFENTAEKIILSEIERLKKEYVADEELASAKRDLIGQDLMARDSLLGLSMILATDELVGLGYNNYKSYEENINKVSKEDIRRAANKYFSPEALNILVVTNNESK